MMSLLRQEGGGLNFLLTQHSLPLSTACETVNANAFLDGEVNIRNLADLPFQFATVVGLVS